MHLPLVKYQLKFSLQSWSLTIYSFLNAESLEYSAINMGGKYQLMTEKMHAIITLSNANILTESNCKIELHYHGAL